MKLSANPLFNPPHTKISSSPCSSSKTHVHLPPHWSSPLNAHPRVSFNPQQHFLYPTSFKISHGFLDPARLNTLPQPDQARIGKRWMEYQGVLDWAGLLDPLDDSLRGEILRYGNFVEAAYRAFEFDPSSPSYGSCKHSKRHLLDLVGFRNTGYRLTRNLRATSGIKVPDWTQSSWMAVQSSWIGFVAVCHDKAEINRLGRRDVIIAFRGTATCLEWIENLRATLAPIEGPAAEPNAGPPMVETGFLSLYTSASTEYPSLQETIRREVGRILELYSNEPLSFTFTGHSLGAALATLAAHDIKTTFNRANNVTVMSFGGPRVGNSSFRSLVEKQGTKILRIVNPGDLITKVPRFVIENNDENNMKNNANKIRKKIEMGWNPMTRLSWPDWIQERVEVSQHWVYVQVGSELRVTNQKVKEPKKPAFSLNDIIDFIKCHDLKTYLHLIKGCSTRCPLRTQARKMLKKAQISEHDLNQTTPITT